MSVLLVFVSELNGVVWSSHDVFYVHYTLHNFCSLMTSVASVQVLPWVDTGFDAHQKLDIQLFGGKKSHRWTIQLAGVWKRENLSFVSYGEHALRHGCASIERRRWEHYTLQRVEKPYPPLPRPTAYIVENNVLVRKVNATHDSLIIRQEGRAFYIY